MDTDSTDEDAAVLRDVVFAYERGLDLPPADSFADVEDYDPDERGGAVLRGLDLDVPAGAFTVVMGASGGGKSTLLRTFNSIIPNFITGSFAGDVNVLGRDATAARVPEMAADVGMVLQDYEAQLFGTSVQSEVAFGPENLAIPPADIDPRADHALEIAGLDDLARRRPPDALSGGQKQRLVFAGVVANHPDLLLLDEPTSDLDPAGSHDTLSVIRSLADADGASAPEGWPGPETIVLVTHEIEEALLADRAVLLRAGRVYREGPARDVFTDVEALRNARVAVPPVVEVFDRLGWVREDLPLYPEEAADAVLDRGLTWTPPARRDAALPGAPADTGRDTGEPLFELEGIVHEYETDRETVRAVDNVDLTVNEREVVAIVGHNGSGKTTLAKHLNGLLEPDAGSARWRGEEVSDRSMSEVGRSVGYVFQNPDHQIFADTVREEVAFGPENFGMEGEELDRAIEDAIETVELDGLEDADPFALSKGQRQRVALASILATDPDAIVFDEPTTGLDATQRDRFMDLVARLNREAGVTVVMVTHSMHTVARYAPRTVVMADGEKVFDRPTRELFADESLLERWELEPPQSVALSNRLATETGQDDALPALSVDEVVAGLGGGQASETETARSTGSVASGDASDADSRADGGRDDGDCDDDDTDGARNADGDTDDATGGERA
ncbi:ABC transporter ATP-binding protein [Halosolutus amylolyticus]|uniref:ABC transporter ATP-binding protein n=1 Tax=Halosolutus amylolyticus TaxID=2932267 RepID=A0ABD5PJ84_9EURY|nr:energy-coupling factor transporter ATPase [Halosolutus amylolyticus]